MNMSHRVRLNPVNWVRTQSERGKENLLPLEPVQHQQKSAWAGHAVSLHSAAVWKTGLALRGFVSSGTCHTGLRTPGRTRNLWCCSHSPSQPPSVPCWPPASCVKLQLKWRNGMGGSMPAAWASSAAYLSDGHPAVHPPGWFTSSGTRASCNSKNLLTPGQICANIDIAALFCISPFEGGLFV